MVIAQHTRPPKYYEPQKIPKYKNHRAEHGDHFHDSAAELRYCVTLSCLQHVGEVHSFEVHKRFILHDRAGKKLWDFYPDFYVRYSDGRDEAVDVKGYQNPKDAQVRLFRAKCQCLTAEYGVPVRVVT